MNIKKNNEKYKGSSELLNLFRIYNPCYYRDESAPTQMTDY